MIFNTKLQPFKIGLENILALTIHFVPQTIGTWNVVVENQTIAKRNMYYINCHCANHNVETYRSKKEEPIVAINKPTTHASKPLKLLNYPYHIYGIVGHKFTNYLRFDEMQNILKDKGDQFIESKPVADIKTIITLIDMVDVNVTTCSKTNEKQMFKDRKPRKNQFVVD